MPNVYFKPLKSQSAIDDIRSGSVELLRAVCENEGVALEKNIPLKVHFGEKGNKTYLPPETYDGVIDYLREREINASFIETSVLYGGERFKRARHLKLAEQHGFTRIPVVIADGENGGDAVEIEINKPHFRTASLARALAESKQVIVLSHFKGHMLAGFGGAIKQLSMGFASKGGKMAMHMGVKPTIVNLFCKRCRACLNRCNEHAITIGKKSFIDHDKCIGCGACFSICPHHAVSIYSLAGLWNALFKGGAFREKLVEYAYASHTGRGNIYISFAVNITKGCDCEPRKLRPAIPDIGIFASLDPVAIDSACFAAAAERNLKFKGSEQLDYAEKIGLGSRSYTLVTL